MKALDKRVGVGVLELFKQGGCRSSITKQEAKSEETIWPTLQALANKTQTRLPPFAYVFLYIDRNAHSKDETERTELIRLFSPPSLLVSKACWEGNGYFGYEPTYDEDNLQACNIWFRCLVKQVTIPDDDSWVKDKQGKIKQHGWKTSPEYVWYEMIFCTHWEPNCCTMYCIDTPMDMQSDLERVFRKSGYLLNFQDPLAMFVPLMDEIVKLYDSSVWGIRDIVRPIEKQREDNINFVADFSILQEISRHSFHVGEVLDVTIGTIEEMRTTRDVVSPPILGKHWDKSNNQLELQMQILNNIKLRQESNQKRLETEITLHYNMITQSDSRVMKAVALLTMVFLPTTFISAIFGMNFFNYSPANGNEPEKFSVSRQVWIFLVIAAILTALTITMWVLWQSLIEKKLRKKKQMEKNRTEKAWMQKKRLKDLEKAE